MVGLAGFRLFLSILAGTGAWIGWKYYQRRRFFKKLAMARIPVLELKRMLDAGEDVVVIDVRGFKPEGRGSAADQPIPGALRIPLSQLAARHDEVPRDRDIVLFCT